MKAEISLIFNESNPYVTILVPKNVRKEMRMLKSTQNESIKQHPSSVSKLLPPW